MGLLLDQIPDFASYRVGPFFESFYGGVYPWLKVSVHVFHVSAKIFSETVFGHAFTFEHLFEHDFYHYSTVSSGIILV